MQDPFSTCKNPTPILTLDETGSTNAEAMRLAISGEAGPLWVNAWRQTAGRGREGREWTSVEGNLHASLLMTLWVETRELPQLSLLAGVALAEAVEELPSTMGNQPIRPCLKWPNDLLFGAAKCAGILVETTALPSGAFGCVIGFGVNIDTTPAIETRPVTSLAQQSIPATPMALLSGIDRALRKRLAAVANPDWFSQLKTDWLSHALPTGSPVTVTTRNEAHSGRFMGLDDDGALLLEDGTGHLRRITHGDVSAGGPVV